MRRQIWRVAVRNRSTLSAASSASRGAKVHSTWPGSPLVLDRAQRQARASRTPRRARSGPAASGPCWIRSDSGSRARPAYVLIGRPRMPGAPMCSSVRCSSATRSRYHSISRPTTKRRLFSASRASCRRRSWRGEKWNGTPLAKYSSHRTQPTPGAQGSTRNVPGSGTMVRLGEPVISSRPMPPPRVNEAEDPRAGGIERRRRDVDVVAAAQRAEERRDRDRLGARIAVRIGPGEAHELEVALLQPDLELLRLPFLRLRPQTVRLDEPRPLRHRHLLKRNKPVRVKHWPRWSRRQPP